MRSRLRFRETHPRSQAPFRRIDSSCARDSETIRVPEPAPLLLAKGGCDPAEACAHDASSSTPPVERRFRAPHPFRSLHETLARSHRAGETFVELGRCSARDFSREATRSEDAFDRLLHSSHRLSKTRFIVISRRFEARSRGVAATRRPHARTHARGHREPRGRSVRARPGDSALHGASSASAIHASCARRCLPRVDRRDPPLTSLSPSSSIRVSARDASDADEQAAKIVFAWTS
jgi:hypothetical protein